MHPDLTVLQTLLAQLREDFKALVAVSAEPSRRTALSSTIQSIDFLLSSVGDAIASRVEAEQRRTACQTSGIRKGILELGILDHIEDASVIDRVEKTADLALTICLA